MNRDSVQFDSSQIVFAQYLCSGLPNLWAALSSFFCAGALYPSSARTAHSPLVQMRSCAVSFKCGCAVKEKFPIFSAGSAGLRAGGGAEESPVVFQRRHRQHTERKNKPTYWAGGRCFQCSDCFGGERSSLGSSLKDQPRLLLVMG